MTASSSQTPALSYRVALYPGSFDPITNGHLDLIERGARMFERLYVGVAVNTGKQPLFSMQERLELIRGEVAGWPNVEVVAFEGLVVEQARRLGAGVLMRGIRTLTDFEYEQAMAHTNRALAGEIETVFVLSSVEWAFVSARLLKEALQMGADVRGFLPARVHDAMRRKLGGG
ncbi:MAG: phosphopantetheine adenylyltransferase [Planctomycetota bacterium]|nr:MAG: phosphopantetheine adenylyltransferase [Planctomycetota bacterium]